MPAWVLRPRRASITNLRSTRRARSATLRFMDPIQARYFSHPEERRNTPMKDTNRKMHRNTIKLQAIVPRFLLSALLIAGVCAPLSRAQQVEEQKGIDQGNYNI